MADEAISQSTESTPPPAPDMAAAPPASAADAQQPSSGDSQALTSAGERHGRLSSIFSSFLRGGAPEPEAAAASDAQQTEEPAPSTDQGEQEQPAADAEPAAPPETLTLTQAELDRIIQSRTDQELARRRDLAQQRQAEEERRRKRREDPIGYAQEEEEREAQVQHAAVQAQQQLVAVTDSVKTVAEHFDQRILNQIFAALPESERGRVFGDGPVGIDGRAKFVADSLQTLAQHYRAEGAKDGEAKAIQRLRNDPTFRKQVYHEFRGSSSEPIAVPATSATGNGRVGSGDPLRDLLMTAPSESAQL